MSRSILTSVSLSFALALAVMTAALAAAPAPSEHAVGNTALETPVALPGSVEGAGPSALAQPVTFMDCLAGAADCCNPLCKPNISGCCVQNGCGLPVGATVTGKGPFTGLKASCKEIAPFQQ